MPLNLDQYVGVHAAALEVQIELPVSRGVGARAQISLEHFA